MKKYIESPKDDMRVWVWSESDVVQFITLTDLADDYLKEADVEPKYDGYRTPQWNTQVGLKLLKELHKVDELTIRVLDLGAFHAWEENFELTEEEIATLINENE